MSRSLQQAPMWVGEGTGPCRRASAGLDEESQGAPSPLEGPTRDHLVAHLAADAEAIGRLVA